MNIAKRPIGHRGPSRKKLMYDTAKISMHICGA
jgi:hypothetical protein